MGDCRLYDTPATDTYQTMNRFFIALAFLALAASAVAEGEYRETNLFGSPPRDIQMDFLEAIMHDGEYPEHFFETPVAGKGSHKEVKPMYRQESELYESLLQVQPMYEQETDLYDSLLQTGSKGIRIKNRLKSAKAVLRKSKAFKKILSSAKSAVVKAIKWSKKLLGRDAPSKPPSSKQMTKNAMYLKAFAEINADKLYSVAKHMGALGALLQDMSVKSKLTPVAQYAKAMKRLESLHGKGLWKYTLQHVADAMYGKGLISLGPIGTKDGNFIRIDPRDIGLIRGFPILDTTATYVGVFQKAISRISKDIIVDLKQKYLAAPFSKNDYDRLFRPTCSGKHRKCFAQGTKGTCDKQSHFGCKWVGQWNGRLAEVPVGSEP